MTNKVNIANIINLVLSIISLRNKGELPQRIAGRRSIAIAITIAITIILHQLCSDFNLKDWTCYPLDRNQPYLTYL